MNGQRRILFLTPQLPYPPHQGTAIRNWHLIRHVAQRYSVDVLSFARHPQAELDAAGPLRDIVNHVAVVPAPSRPLRRRLWDLLLGRADMTRRLYSEPFKATLATWLAHGYDVVQAEGIEMAPYLAAIREWETISDELAERERLARPVFRLPTGARRLVYDAHNAEALLQQRNCLTDARRPRRWHAAVYSLVQWRRLARAEANLMRLADRVVAVSDADAQALRRLAPTVSPLVVPNGVDTAYYDPACVTQTPVAQTFPPSGTSQSVRKHTAQTAKSPKGGKSAPLLVFTGKLDYRPNVEACLWLAQQVMPRVWAAQPTTQVMLVGRDPAPAVQALASDRITVTGWVPDTRPYMAAATVFVAPLRVGGGTRLKLLEALAMGCALVSTRQGAEGLDLADAALLADEAADFAEAVVRLICDDARRVALGQAARRLALARYDWSTILPRLADVYA